MIETTTTYSYKLKYIDNPTFDKILDLTNQFIEDLPKEIVDIIHEEINDGTENLSTEPQMLMSLHSYGNNRKASLNFAFDKIPSSFFNQPEINIIDYGCGQAIGTMCFNDYLKTHKYSQKIKSVILIDPSEISLKRAAIPKRVGEYKISNFLQAYTVAAP